VKRFMQVFAPVVVLVALVLPFGSAHATTVNYVALGDSYSSGVGTNHYDLSATCKRSSLAYPALLQAAKGYALNFQACTGATTSDVITKQVPALSGTTNLVTVTAGGNDAGFTSLLVNCTLTNCVSSINSTITWVNTSLAARLDAMDAQIKSHAPGATVVVLGYPRLFSGTCFAALGISSSEVTAANALADAIGTVTNTEAAKYGFTYKSAIAQFTNHGVCAASAWLNGLNLANTSESYHPNATGQSSGYEPLVRAVTG
jgi:lysophospholipase L1-like esterase